jgi:thioredoxin-like negative regulator of GroEL
VGRRGTDDERSHQVTALPTVVAFKDGKVKNKFRELLDVDG